MAHILGFFTIAKKIVLSLVQTLHWHMGFPIQTVKNTIQLSCTDVLNWPKRPSNVINILSPKLSPWALKYTSVLHISSFTNDIQQKKQLI